MPRTWRTMGLAAPMQSISNFAFSCCGPAELALLPLQPTPLLPWLALNTTATPSGWTVTPTSGECSSTRPPAASNRARAEATSAAGLTPRFSTSRVNSGGLP